MFPSGANRRSLCSLVIGIPTLNRYDLLARLVTSLAHGSVHPAAIIVVNNGGEPLGKLALPIRVYTPDHPLGLAESWNWVTTQSTGRRVIVNDDVTFAGGSLEALAKTTEPFVSALAGSNAFSCFVLDDACVDRVGLFDEGISPGYAYFEDNDYAERMEEAGVALTSVEVGVEHLPSSTMTKYSPAELRDHHRKFDVAKANFVAKWGRLPRGYRS